VQNYRPLELGRLFLWAAAAQLIVFPLAWWLLQRIDGRWIIASGLMLFGFAAILASGGSALVAADQLRLSMAMAGAGQVLFLVPNLVAGGSLLKPADGPTASLMFNATTVGGASLGVALASELVTKRHDYHFALLAESAFSYGASGERIDALAALFASRLGDETIAGARALASLGAALHREAWALAFNDGFFFAGALLIAAAAGALLLPRQRLASQT
jgi:DHA2 family multidrug resistance protein